MSIESSNGSKYANTNCWQVSHGGGFIRGTTNSDGEEIITTSYPCRMAYVQAVGSSLTSAMYMNIGPDASIGVATCVASVALGIRIPVCFGSAVVSDAAGTAEYGGAAGPQWIELPIDNVAKLHFYADGTAELINILYRT